MAWERAGAASPPEARAGDVLSRVLESEYVCHRSQGPAESGSWGWGLGGGEGVLCFNEDKGQK